MSDDEQDDGTLDLRKVARRVGLFVVVAVLGIIALATLPGVGEIRDRVDSASRGWFILAGVCSLASMLSFVVALWGAFNREVPPSAAVALGFAEQGANVLLPAGGTGGPALGAVLMRRAGVPGRLAAERHVALFLVTSAVSLGALVVFGFGEASGILPGDAPFLLLLLPGAGGLLGILIAYGFSRTTVPEEPPKRKKVRHLTWRLRRFLHGGVNTSLELLKGDPFFAAGSVGYFAFDVAALACAFQAFGGGSETFGIFVLAYTMGHAGALIPTPGGVGGTDGGLIGMFVVFGTPLGLATVSVLGYRVFQLGLPVVLGAVSIVRIRMRLADPSRRAAVEARYAEYR